jgi:hypothetical protein
LSWAFEQVRDLAGDGQVVKRRLRDGRGKKISVELVTLFKHQHPFLFSSKIDVIL